MEYTALMEMPFYRDCAPVVEALSLVLVELTVSRHRGGALARVVIAPAAADAPAVAVTDCARVHRALAPVLEALVTAEDLGMEVTSPGIERKMKNAAEFALYKGREVRIWDTRTSDWRSGVVVAASETTVTLEFTDTTEEIPFALIAKAKLI
jgi:ribosome maturation factor RimP